MKFQHILKVLLLLMSFSGCVEPFEPDLENYESVLIIDGILTNKDEPYSVSISRSYEYNESRYEEISGADVKVVDDWGNEYRFIESRPGTYIKQDTTFIGEPGRRYQLLIETGNDQYASTFQLMPDPVPVDSVYFKFDTRVSNDDDGKTKGIQVYIDASNPKKEVDYFAWEFSETWQFVTPYTSGNRSNVTLCYRSGMSSSFILENSLKFENSALKKQPLHFVSDNSNRLMRRYSMLVKQYTLSEEAYLFLTNIKTNNETTGSLFDPTPVMISGNIESTSGSDMPVLGFFQVSAVSTKRLFVDRTELPDNLFIPSGFESCLIEEVSINDADEIRRQKIIGRTIMDTITEPVRGTFIRFVNFESCFDCTLSGSNIKPDFWID